jgi:MYXO-CTERM domain-containing protein
VAVLVGLAAGPVQAEPAVVWVPTENVVLSPTGTGPCGGLGGQTNSARGCADIDAVEGVPPHADAVLLRESLAAALAAYDVHLAEERPPEYLQYTMLLPSDGPQPRATSFTCSSGGINCGARKRNDIARVLGPTQSCATSDVLLASLYVLGRVSGLEGVADPLDAMHYVPDFAMGSGAFVDGCSAIVQQLAFDDEGGQIELPLECTGLDHQGCDAGEQNSHADLLAAYGPRTVDLEPPVLSRLSPGDGAVIPSGGELVLDVTIDDADPVVGGRWTVSSPELESLGVEDGVLTVCTNDLCFVNWSDATPLKATDSDWNITIASLPDGVYELVFEASDFHGNMAEPVLMVVEIGGESPGTGSDGVDSGDPDSGAGSAGTDSGEGFTTTVGTTVGSGPIDGSGGGDDVGPGDGSGSSGLEEDDGLVDHGCACKASRPGGAAGWSWLGVLALGLGRRRRRSIR